MPSAKLTDRMIQTVRVAGKREDHWDTVVPGLGLRVSPKGAKVFYVRYRYGTHRRRLRLAPYPALSLGDARKEAKEILLGLARGDDPQLKRQAARKAISFEDLAELYLEKHAKRKKRSWPEDERLINRELLPRWRDRRAKNIRRRDVIELLDSIVERGAPIQANRVKALVSKIYNFGAGRDIV